MNISDLTKNLLNSIPYPLALKDVKSVYRQCNKAFCEFTGKSFNEIIGKTDYDLFLPEKAEENIISDNELIEKGKQKNEHWKVKVIDDVSWFQVSKTPLQNSNNVIIGIVYSISNITDLKAKIDYLESRNNELEQSNDNNSKLIKLIVNDLRAPLSSIIGFAELLLTESYGDEESLRFSRFIFDSANNLFTLLDSLLLSPELRSDDFTNSKELVDISQIINTSINIFKYPAKQKRIAINYKSEKELVSKANNALLSATLRNLISNAMKFTDYNGEISIRANIVDHFLVISVEDNGRGIPEENLSEILNRNKEFTTIGTDKEQGYGIGLNLCQEFTELQGGELTIKSNVLKGTVVNIILPV